MEKSIDNKGSSAVLLTDFSKAFDCLICDLLIAKRNAYGVSYVSFKLLIVTSETGDKGIE